MSNGGRVVYVHNKYTSIFSSIPGTYSSIQDMYPFWYCCVQPTHERRRASDGASDVWIPQYSLCTWCCFDLVVVVGVVCRFFDHSRLVWESRACLPGPFRPRISPWVRGHGYRQGGTGALPPRGPALVEARAKASG